MNKLERNYRNDFVPSQSYLDGMPDLQNGEFFATHIERVGISQFKLPLKLRTKSGDVVEVEATIDGMVSLDADKRGINMSRIIRSFYKFQDEVFDIDVLGSVLSSYRKDLESFEAQINISFNYRMWLESLVSVDDEGNKNGGWQYYNITLSGLMDDSGFRKTMILDFLYSSTCPCSTELSFYNAEQLGVYGAPHAQRSTMRMYADFNDFLWIEDVVQVMRDALKTETQVFVKREDEANFSWLCGANPKFVEDAIRDAASGMHKLVGSVYDFKLVCSHNESLHNHNAISVYIPSWIGRESRFSPNVSIDELKSLVK